MPQENASTKTIYIVTQDAPSGARADEGTSNPWHPGNAAAKAVRYAQTSSVQVSVATLEANMSEFIEVVGGVFAQADKKAEQKSGMQLDEVELSVEITGNGEVKLMGTGVDVGAKGAITLKFKRAG